MLQVIIAYDVLCSYLAAYSIVKNELHKCTSHTSPKPSVYNKLVVYDSSKAWHQLSRRVERDDGIS